tara:strand:- start:1130 stop:1780 length:651 start_codon:yes stop_codon:yes gene_type:complete
MTTLVFVSVFTTTVYTRATFRTQLRTRFDEDSADVITDLQIDGLIDQGLRDINFRTRLLPEYAEVTLDASTSYDLPANMTKIDEVIWIDTNNKFIQLDNLNLAEIQAEGFDNSRPKFWIRDGSKISIFGNTLSAGTLRVYGSRIPTLPTSDGDNINIPDQYLELLFLWCEWKYYMRKRIPDEAAILRDLYFSMAELSRDEIMEEFNHGVTLYGKGS